MIRYEVRRKIVLTNGEVFDLPCRTYHDKVYAYNMLEKMRHDSSDATVLYIKEIDYDCSSG